MLNSCDTEISDAMTNSVSYRMIKRIMKSSNIQKSTLLHVLMSYIRSRKCRKIFLQEYLIFLNINIRIKLLYSEKSIVLNWALTWIKIFKAIYLKREKKLRLNNRDRMTGRLKVINTFWLLLPPYTIQLLESRWPWHSLTANVLNI